MVTFAQAQERAEEWINGDVPGYQHREVRVREFDLGFVVWAEDRAEGPRSDGGAQRLVIARDSGEATLWPALPVGEVIRRYEEEYGLSAQAPDAAPAPPARVDLNQTSFLLTPPEWLQEAADRMGIPDHRDRTSGGAAAGARPGAAVGDAVPSAGAAAPADAVPGEPAVEPADAVPVADAAPAGPGGAGGPLPETLPGPGVGPSAPSGAGAPAARGAGTAWPAAGGDPSGGAPPADATPWAGTDTNAEPGEDRSVPLPVTVYAPQIRDVGDEGAPPAPGTAPEARTKLISGGSRLPQTAVAPALDTPQSPAFPQGTPPQSTAPQGAPAPGAGAGPGTPPPGAPPYGGPQGAPQQPPAPAPVAPQTPPAPSAPGRPLPPDAGDIADAATSKAQAPPRGARGAGAPGTPPPPGAPGTPGVRPGGPPPASGPGAPGAPAGGYVPTQLVSQLGSDGPEG
ncbi:hypothetical protein FGF04_29230, partial [Streptomyces apricus]